MKIHMVSLLCAEKALDSTQRSFIIQTLSKLGIKGKLLSLMKDIYEKTFS